MLKVFGHVFIAAVMGIAEVGFPEINGQNKNYFIILYGFIPIINPIKEHFVDSTLFILWSVILDQIVAYLVIDSNIQLQSEFYKFSWQNLLFPS